jgi:hypothetical protein
MKKSDRRKCKRIQIENPFHAWRRKLIADLLLCGTGDWRNIKARGRKGWGTRNLFTEDEASQFIA